MPYLASWRYSDDGSIIEVTTTSSHPFSFQSLDWKEQCKDTAAPPLCYNENNVIQLRPSCPLDLFALSWKKWMEHGHAYSYKRQDSHQEKLEGSSSTSRQKSHRSTFSQNQKQHSYRTSLNVNGIQLSYVEDSSSSSEEEEEEEFDSIEEGDMEGDGGEIASWKTKFPSSVPSHGTVLKLPPEFIYEPPFNDRKESKNTQQTTFENLIEALEAGGEFLHEEQSPWVPVLFGLEKGRKEGPYSLPTFFSCNFLFLGYNEEDSSVVLLPDPILCASSEGGDRNQEGFSEESYGFYSLPLVHISRDNLFLLLRPFAMEIISGPTAFPSGEPLEPKSMRCIRIPFVPTTTVSPDLEDEMKPAPSISVDSACRVEQSPSLNVDLLPLVFRVLPQREYYLSSIKRYVIFLGVCSGLPWVQYRVPTRSQWISIDDNSEGAGSEGKSSSAPTRLSPALPLTLCYHEKDLRIRYGLCDATVDRSLCEKDRKQTVGMEKVKLKVTASSSTMLEASLHYICSTSSPFTSVEGSPPVNSSDRFGMKISTPRTSSRTASATPTMMGQRSSGTSLCDSAMVRHPSTPCPPVLYQTPSPAHPMITVTGPYGTPIHCQKDAHRWYGVRFPDRVVGREGLGAVRWHRLIHMSPQRGHRSEARGEASQFTAPCTSEAYGGMKATVIGLYHHDLVLLFDGQQKACFLRSGTSQEEFMNAFELLVSTNESPMSHAASLQLHSPPCGDTSTSSGEARWRCNDALEILSTEMGNGDTMQEVRRSVEKTLPPSEAELTEEREPFHTRRIPLITESVLGENDADEDSISKVDEEKKANSFVRDAPVLSLAADDPLGLQAETNGSREGGQFTPSADVVQTSFLSSEANAISRGGAPLINFMKGFAAMKIAAESVEAPSHLSHKGAAKEVTRYYHRSLDHLLQAHDRYMYYCQNVESAVEFFSYHTPDEIHAFLLLNER